MTMPISNEVVNHSVEPAAFADLYAGKAPWETGRPQGPFAAAGRTSSADYRLFAVAAGSRN